MSRKMLTGLILTLGFLFGGPVALAGERPLKGGQIKPDVLYHNYCSVCHGDRGDGRSRARASLNPPPRDFSAATDLSRATMITIVTHGKGGTANATTTITVVKPVVKEIVFEDVHFDFDRSALLPDALRVLDEAVTALQANATLKLEIEGHTCNIGTAEYNLALGERRAKTVLDYLASRGIGADRLRMVSYGEERPKFDNAREETRRLNRRAALVVRIQ